MQIDCTNPNDQFPLSILLFLENSRIIAHKKIFLPKFRTLKFVRKPRHLYGNLNDLIDLGDPAILCNPRNLTIYKKNILVGLPPQSEVMPLTQRLG